MVKDFSHDEGPHTDLGSSQSKMPCSVLSVPNLKEKYERKQTMFCVRKFGNGFYLHIAEKVCGNVADWR